MLGTFPEEGEYIEELEDTAEPDEEKQAVTC